MFRGARFALFTTLCASLLAQETPVFRASSRLVLMQFSVIEGRAFQLDLSPEDVEVLVDGEPVPIAVFEPPDIGGPGRPVEVNLLFDISGSVGGPEILDAALIRKSLLNQAGGRISVGVYAFSNSLHRLTKPTRDGTALHSALGRAAEIEGRGTRLYESVMEACRDIGSRPERGARILVAFSDGRSSPINADDAASVARLNGVRIFPVLIGTSSASSERGRIQIRQERFGSLGEGTGGLRLIPKSVTRTAVEKILEALAHNIQAEYVIGFYPPAGDEAGLHEAVLKVPALPDAEIRGGKRAYRSRED